MIMLKLKLVMLVMLDKTVRVTTAVTLLPAVRLVCSWFQVKVM